MRTTPIGQRLLSSGLLSLLSKASSTRTCTCTATAHTLKEPAGEAGKASKSIKSTDSMSDFTVLPCSQPERRKPGLLVACADSSSSTPRYTIKQDLQITSGLQRRNTNTPEQTCAR